MDKIEFKISNVMGEWGEYDPVTIFINGIDLIELLKIHELPYAKTEGAENIAGDYAGHTSDALYDLLMNPEPVDNEILVCTCYCYGCWPMLVTITETDHTVVWSDFEQPHRRGKWDYSNFGPFVFEKEQYFREIEKLRDHEGDRNDY